MFFNATAVHPSHLDAAFLSSFPNYRVCLSLFPLHRPRLLQFADELSDGRPRDGHRGDDIGAGREEEGITGTS